MRTTLGQAKEFGIANAIGVTPSDPRFIRYLNEAQQRLAYRGPWVGMIQRTRICLEGPCIICPRDIINLDGVLSGCEQVNVHNQWYEYLGPQVNPNCLCDCSIHLIQRGITSFQRSFTGPSMLSFYADECDYGKTVLVQGTDQNGVVVRTQKPDGSWETGERVTLAGPFATTVTIWSSLTAIQKDETTHSVEMFRSQDVGSAANRLAEYGPSETVPQYLKYELCGKLCQPGCEPCGIGCDGNPCSATSITVLARLGPTPVKADSDYLLIGNLPALKDMMQAVRAIEQGQFQAAAALEGSAISQLKAEKRAYYPQHQASVNVRVMGTATFDKIMCGFI